MRTGPRRTCPTQRRAWFANPRERLARVEEGTLTQIANSTRHPNAIVLMTNVQRGDRESRTALHARAPDVKPKNFRGNVA